MVVELSKTFNFNHLCIVSKLIYFYVIHLTYPYIIKLLIS